MPPRARTPYETQRAGEQDPRTPEQKSLDAVGKWIDDNFSPDAARGIRRQARRNLENKISDRLEEPTNRMTDPRSYPPTRTPPKGSRYSVEPGATLQWNQPEAGTYEWNENAGGYTLKQTQYFHTGGPVRAKGYPGTRIRAAKG